MNETDNRRIFASNLRMLMILHDKTRTQICNDLSIKYTTFANWYNGEKYPRIDKIELLAEYFGVSKSELIEEQDTVSALGALMDGADAPADVDELLALYRHLNEEGQERLLEYARDLVASGRYIKTGAPVVGKKA